MNTHQRADAEEKSLAEVFDMVGFGRFQMRLLLIAGCGFMADSIEVGVVTFLERKIPEEWPEAEGWALNALSMSVFGTKLLGSCIWGSLSDRLGRRRAFLLANVFLLVTGCLSAASPSYTWLVVARGLVGLAIGGVVIPFDNLAESVPEKYSSTMCYAIEYAWTIGTLYTNALAAAIMETWGWRIYLLLTALPILLACIGYLYLEESPLWLLDRGYDDDALETLRRIAAVNNRELGNIALVSYAHEAEPNCTERHLCDDSCCRLVGFGAWDSLVIMALRWPAASCLSPVERWIILKCCSRVLAKSSVRQPCSLRRFESVLRQFNRGATC